MSSPDSDFPNPDDAELIAFSTEALGLSETVALRISPLAKRGSDRTFFRLTWNHKGSAILIRYEPRCVENTHYASIARFLREIDVPVPRLLHHDPARNLVLMEDLGESDLWSFREMAWDTRRTLYQKTLAAVRRLHAFPIDRFPWDRVNLMEGFGPNLYAWERNYFRDHFVRDFCGIEIEFPLERELEAELSNLAERVSSTGLTLVHRDFQSQNVMIRDGEPYLIDFQGMRLGSPFYDLGSLLFDPYVSLPDGEREELLSFYYRASEQGLDWEPFLRTFREASAQRLLQALGAYGFLGLKKGLKAFLGHIPSGIHSLLHLSEILSLPRLHALCLECQGTIGLKRKGAN